MCLAAVIAGIVFFTQNQVWLGIGIMFGGLIVVAGLHSIWGMLLEFFDNVARIKNKICDPNFAAANPAAANYARPAAAPARAAAPVPAPAPAPAPAKTAVPAAPAAAPVRAAAPVPSAGSGWFCTKCGNNNAADNAFCTKCGTKRVS